jgi:hypothetical protein
MVPARFDSEDVRAQEGADLLAEQFLGVVEFFALEARAGPTAPARV